MWERRSGAVATKETRSDLLAIGEGERPETLPRRLVLHGGAAWSATIAVLALLGLADTIVTQIVFSAYAVSGGGASSVAAPPLLVAASLVASGLAGLLLALDQWRQTQRQTPRRDGQRRDLGSMWRWLVAAPVRLQATWRRWLSGLQATSAALRTTLAAARRAGIQLTARGWTSLCLAVLALGVSLAADIGAATPASRPAAQWAWIASVALLVAAAFMSQSRPAQASSIAGRPSWRDLNHRFSAWRWHWPDYVLVGLLLAGALALRLPNLTGLPYVVHGDEAWNGLEALRWLNGGVPSLLSVGWYGLPAGGYGLPALVMHFAGANLWGLRLSSVLIGTFSIALLYALAREFTSRRVSFLAAALLTVSHLHIQFSRMGIHYIHGMTAVLLVLWLLARALRRGSATAAVLVAAAMSLSLQVYFSARIVFVIVPLFLLGLVLLGTARRIHYAVLLGRGAKASWLPNGAPMARQAWLKTVGWLALGLLVAIGPLAVYFQQDMGSLTGRPAEVLILNLTPYRRQSLLAQFGTTDLRAILGKQLAAVPLIPGGLADQSLQYGPHYAMLDPLVAALVLIGFWYAVCTLRRPLSLLLVIWVLSVVTLCGVLTIDMPWWPRLLAMLPAMCLLAALALDGLLRAVARAAADVWHLLWRLRWSWGWRWETASGGRLARVAGAARVALGAVVILAVVGFSLGQTIQHYYVQYPKGVNTDTYRTRYTDLAYYAATLPSWSHVILYDSGDLLLDYSTIKFLAPDLNGTRASTPAALKLALARALVKRTGLIVVIVSPGDVTSFQQTLAHMSKLPPGSFQAVRDGFGVTAFYTYTVL